jgi:hypothetical protein
MSETPTEPTTLQEQTPESPLETPVPQNTPETNEPQPEPQPETQETNETQPEIRTNNVLSMPDETVFLLQKFMVDSEAVIARINSVTKSYVFGIVGDRAAFLSDDVPIMVCKWSVIGEFIKEADANALDVSIGPQSPTAEGPQNLVFHWAWDHEIRSRVDVMKGIFTGDLEVLNNPVVKFEDPMLLNIIMAHTSKEMNLEYACAFKNQDQPAYVIFGFWDLEWNPDFNGSCEESNTTPSALVDNMYINTPIVDNMSIPDTVEEL